MSMTLTTLTEAIIFLAGAGFGGIKMPLAQAAHGEVM